MSGTHGAQVAWEFVAQVDLLYEKIKGDGLDRPLSLSEIESLEIGPLLAAQEAVDKAGFEILSVLSVPDLLTLSHRVESILHLLAPFGREDGRLALRIASLSGKGPQGAYKKASKDSSALFRQNSLGEA